MRSYAVGWFTLALINAGLAQANAVPESLTREGVPTAVAAQIEPRAANRSRAECPAQRLPEILAADDHGRCRLGAGDGDRRGAPGLVA